MSHSRKLEPSPSQALLREDLGSSFDDQKLDQAVKIWNRLVQTHNPLIRLTNSMRLQFGNLFEKLFQNDLHKWTLFCQKVADNKFLMGKEFRGWRVRFEWVLEESHVTDVLNGRYWFKPPFSSASAPQSNFSQINKEIS